MLCNNLQSNSLCSILCGAAAESFAKDALAMKKLLSVLSTVLVALTVLLAVLLVGLRLVGFQLFTVLSGSMVPVYPVGSVIYVKAVDPASLQVGDDITFMASETVVATHRIIEILPDEKDPAVLWFRTQGVANDAPDANPVHCNNVIGSPVFSLPLLGYIAVFVQQPPGSYVAVALAVLLVALVFLPDMLFGDDGQSKKRRVRRSELSPPKE